MRGSTMLELQIKYFLKNITFSYNFPNVTIQIVPAISDNNIKYSEDIGVEADGEVRVGTMSKQIITFQIKNTVAPSILLISKKNIKWQCWNYP